MKRTDAFGATVDNKFTNGDPATAVPATRVDASWLNAVQEEIAKVIEGAGLALNPAVDTQLKQAIALLAGGGGGGAGGGVWNEPPGLTPASDVENGEKVYLFEKALANYLVRFIKVPTGYVAGNQIRLLIPAYSPSNSNGFLMKARTYLVRKGVDPVGDVTNLNTSVNTILTNTVANQYREVEIDLTDASGQVNSVAVGAGDMLRVELYRDDSDSDTAEVRFIPSGTEVLFV